MVFDGEVETGRGLLLHVEDQIHDLLRDRLGVYADVREVLQVVEIAQAVADLLARIDIALLYWEFAQDDLVLCLDVALDDYLGDVSPIALHDLDGVRDLALLLVALLHRRYRTEHVALVHVQAAHTVKVGLEFGHAHGLVRLLVKKGFKFFSLEDFIAFEGDTGVDVLASLAHSEGNGGQAAVFLLIGLKISL